MILDKNPQSHNEGNAPSPTIWPKIVIAHYLGNHTSNDTPTESSRAAFPWNLPVPQTKARKILRIEIQHHTSIQ